MDYEDFKVLPEEDFEFTPFGVYGMKGNEVTRICLCYSQVQALQIATALWHTYVNKMMTIEELEKRGIISGFSSPGYSSFSEFLKG